MEYAIGLLLTLAVIGTSQLAGIDRGRNFYPLMLIVVGSYYVLFAVMLASPRTVLIEAAVAVAFVLVAVVGYRRNLWFVALALVGHGLFDTVHHTIIDNAGVPAFWPGFCMAFDIAAGGILALQLAARRITSRSEPGAVLEARP